MERLKKTRDAEKASHEAVYSACALFSSGSWLAKPVRTVLDLLPSFEGCHEFRALDLGCGVGRNCIPVAQAFSHIPCRVDCVDILELAIEKLNENAKRFGISHAIHGVTAAIDEYQIEPDCYDLIMAVSALEHTDSKAAFVQKLEQIRNGIRAGGIACLIINTGVRENDKATGNILPPQFEVNLQTEEFQRLMVQIFTGWNVIKHTVVHQKYDIPRESGIAELETDVVTWVVRRE